MAIVFEHAFAPDPAPPDVELVPLFDDPLRALLPAAHPLAGAPSVTAADLAARHLDPRPRRLGRPRWSTTCSIAPRLRPAILHAGHGDEPVEAQAFVAAGRGITLAHRLNVLLNPEQVTAVPLAGDAPVRHVQAAIMREQRAPAARAVLDALREVGRRRAQLSDA